MAGFPDVKVEIGFDGGLRTPLADVTWTDVSAYVDSDVEITWGRSSKLEPASPLVVRFTLDNSDGRFSAGLASSPYYPNVKFDRPIRVTVTPNGGAPSERGVFYFDDWPSSWPDGTDSYAAVDVVAPSRLGRLGGRNALMADVVHFALANSATSVFPLNDAEGTRQAASVVGSEVLRVAGSGTDLRFSGDAVQLRGGEYLTSGIALGTDYTVAVSFFSTSRGGRFLLPCVTGSDTGLADANDGTWHRLVLTVTGGVDAGGAVYLDGSPTGITTGVSLGALTIGRPIGDNKCSAWVSDVVYAPVVWDATDVENDYAAFTGGFGDTTHDRLERYASYVGIPSVEVDADTGAVLMGSTDIAGLAAADAFRVVESTEGGVLTDGRDGALRLIGRRARYHSAVDVTLDMALQQVERGFAPTLDRALLRNEITGTNAATSVSGGTGESVSFTVRDDASIDEYGVASSSVEVNAVHDFEAFTAASWIVANHAEPGVRVPELALDLLPFDAGDQDDLLAVFIGSRVEVTNLPAQAPTTSMEFFVEGGTETFGATSAELRWTVSPIGLEDSIVIIDDAVFGQIDAGNYIGY